MKNLLIPLAKKFLLLLGVTDAAIEKKIYGSGLTALIISKKEIKGIKK